mgnify:CR=1 FL=1
MDINLMRKELIRDEGLRLKPYKDTVGKTTIGIGRNLDDVGISKDEAYLMLDNDIQRTSDSLDKNLPWWKTLDEVRQRVILNMAYNLGINSLLGFKNTLAAIQAGRYNDAADGMLASKWATQVGARATRLADMMRGE